MKKLLIMITVVFATLNLYAAEAVVLKPNMEVRMGELTGAGSRFSLKALAGFVHPDGVILKEDCQEIVVKNSADPKISDVVKIKVQNQEINSNELTGFIIQK
jgi:hypothetical protein